jgi:hypothetical protein
MRPPSTGIDPETRSSGEGMTPPLLTRLVRAGDAFVVVVPRLEVVRLGLREGDRLEVALRPVAGAALPSAGRG